MNLLTPVKNSLNLHPLRQICKTVSPGSSSVKISKNSEQYPKVVSQIMKEPVGKTKKASQTGNIKGISLSYQGNKTNWNKGKLSERKDVLYKTLFRAIRRFMQQLFAKESGLEFPKTNASYDEYTPKVLQFHHKYMDKY